MRELPGDKQFDSGCKTLPATWLGALEDAKGAAGACGYRVGLHRTASVAGFVEQNAMLFPVITQSRIKLNPHVVDARMKAMTIRTSLIGKCSRRGKHFRSV